MDENAVSNVTKDAIDFIVKSDPKLVSVERRKKLLKAKIKAKQLHNQERDLHNSLPQSIERVVHDKKSSCGKLSSRRPAPMTWVQWTS